MNIGLIGCGRVGTTITFLLRRKHNIVGVHDIKPANMKRTMRLLRLKQPITLECLVLKSTALFLATPDDAIVDAYRSIEPYVTGRKYICHFSGALPSTVIPKKRGVYRAAVHPFATFPRLIIPPQRKRIPLYIEGNTHAIAAAKRIFQGHSFLLRTISRENKIYCHMAGVFSSNFLIALVIDTLELMKQARMPHHDFPDVILPIIKDALCNIKDHGVHASLSGPLQRGDVETIKKHISALHHDPILMKTYRILSLSILETLPKCKNKEQLQNILKPDT